MEAAGKGPKFVRLFGPVIDALKELGGSGKPAEVRDVVAKNLSLSDEVQSEVLASGAPRFDNQVAWARFYLAKAGFIDASERGVWSLTDQGLACDGMSHAEALEIFRATHSQFSQSSENDENGEAEEESEAPEGDGYGTGYRTKLTRLLYEMPPAGFERFCQRLLRESGFEQVNVTGKSGDGGIDGIGVLQVNPLVSFKVLFQSKRYTTGAVTPSQVRDFRGSMMGRADKGIIITTGKFTAEARKEAVRDGVPPIELVDGDKLIDMLIHLKLGVEPVMTYEVDEKFFEEFN